MSSKAQQARETQKEYYEKAIQRWRNLLAEKGVDKARIQKDPHLKHLQAKLRKSNMRIRAIEALKKQKEDMALRKQKKLEAKTAKPPEGAPEEGKKKPEKEKKKEKKKES